VVNHEIRGDWSQIVVCRLHQGQEVYSESGRFMWKTPNVRVSARPPAQGAPDPSRGTGLLGRALSAGGQAGRRGTSTASPNLPHFRAAEGQGLCTFTGAGPGELRQIELNGSRAWTVSRDAFVAAEDTLGCRIGVEGQDLLRFSGSGDLFIAAAGEFVDLNPADVGGAIEVSPRRVVAFDGGVTLTAKGLDAALPMVTLRGDGKVILQA
jgi:uncharacterized protein (AIM24 family)